MDRLTNTPKHLIISGMMNQAGIISVQNVPNLFADRLVNHWTKTLTEYLIIPIYEINMLGI